MKKLRIQFATCIIAAGFLLAGEAAQAQTTIYTDNFNIPDTLSLDGSTQTGRHTGVSSNDVVGRSGGVQHTITNNALNLLRAGSNAGRMRFHSATNTANRWDWAFGAAGAQILTDGGMQISFDWTATNNVSQDWISYCVGINTNTDPGLRVVEAGTDSGILLRNAGGYALFDNGAGGASGGDSSFNVTSLTRHVDLKYAFTSWADGATVNLSVYVDSVFLVSQTFTWAGQSGVHHMEIASLANGTKIDNFSISSFAPPPFLNVSAVSDSPATNYAGRIINLIGTVAGTLPITNQWKVDKGGGFTNVSAFATNSTLTLSNAQVLDSGTYALFSSNIAGSTNSAPIVITVVPATTNDSINLQFTGSSFGSGNAPAFIGGALIGGASDVWNTISNPLGDASPPPGKANATGRSLVDVLNIGTAFTMDYVADYLFNGRAFGASGPFYDGGSPYRDLMTGYMGSVSTGGNPDTNTVTLHNLKPGSYDLYLYAAGRNDGQTRVNVLTANGLTAVCGPNSGNNTFIAGTNYVHLTPTVTSNGLLNLSMYGTADAGQGLMNGFQLNGPVTLPSLFLSSDTTSDSPATNYVGRTVTLAAAFSGNPPPVLQWKVDHGGGFTNVSAGATNGTLILPNVQTSDSGSYSLFASNVVGVSNSTPLALTVLAVPNTNFGVNLNVQFVGTSRGTGFAQTQSGPGNIGNAGDLWNPVSNPNPVLPSTAPIFGNGQILADAAGVGTTMTIDYTGNADLNSGINSPFFTSGSPVENLMQACLTGENGNSATVTLHGLQSGTYDLYLYSVAGNGVGQSNVTQFTANGITATAGPNEGVNALLTGTNYLHLTPIVTGSGLLNISFVGTAAGGGSQLNGLQVTGPSAPLAPLILGLQHSGSQLTLTWPYGTLLEATNLLGPWTTNIATSPFTNTSSLSIPQMYYRVQAQ